MKKPKKRGKAPPFAPPKGSPNSTSNDPLRATVPLPPWMNDPSLLPKKPPGRA